MHSYRDHPLLCKSTESTLGEEVNPVVHFKTIDLSYCACMHKTSLRSQSIFYNPLLRIGGRGI